MADLLDPAALHAARWWAETHDHPQPDDRMLAAYGQVIAENIARAIEAEAEEDRRHGLAPRHVANLHRAAAIARRAGDRDGTATP